MNKDSIVLIRLLTGEEIIGKVLITDETGIKLKNPCHLIMQQDQAGQAKLMMQPFWQYVEEDALMFSWSSIVTDATPVAEIRNQWNQRFGTGIIEPDLPTLHKV